MSEITMKTNPMKKIFSNRNFLLLWIGSFVSILGSQLSLIAMPWLMLQLTGDPLALGTALALAGIPRAAFILLGGAISDRFSPRNVLLFGDLLNFLLTGLAAILVFSGLMQVWMLYIFSLITGLLSGFVLPASNSIARMLLDEESLQVGNAMTIGTSQLAGFVGPAIAGTIIGAYVHSSQGITVAFAVDAITFAFSALLLAFINGQGPLALENNENILNSIHNGWNFMWHHSGIRFMFILIAAMNFLFVGPLLVGIPVLAAQRLPEGAQAFGYLMSAYAGGNLIGLVLAAVLPKQSGRASMAIIVGVLVAFGVVLISLGSIQSTAIGAVLLVVIGVGNGYISLVAFTWVQLRTPKDMLGRVMSMVMLMSLGLVPLSQAVAGAVSKWNLTDLFFISGSMILLVACWAVFQPGLRSASEEIVNSSE